MAAAVAARCAGSATAWLWKTCLGAQLHGDMLAAMDSARDSASHAPGSMHPLVKSFCDGFMDEKGPSGSAVQAGAAGALALFGACLATGQLWAAYSLVALILLSLLSLGAGAASVKAACEKVTTDLAVKPGADERGLVDLKQDDKVTEAVMRDILHVAPGEVAQYTRDPACVGVTEYIVAMVKFQFEYRKFTYHTQTLRGGQEVKPVAGQNLDKDLEGLTLSELAERLHDKLGDSARNWCDSYRTIHKLLNEGVERAMNTFAMQAASAKRKEAVDEAKMKRALKFDEVGKAISAMKSPDGKKLIAGAKVFLHNVHRQNPEFSTVHHEMEELQRLNTELDECRKEEAEAAGQHAKRTACAAKWATKLRQIVEAKAGSKANQEYLERELQVAGQKLDAARSDEKRYTYWMFGIGVGIWENDVKLAKSKVSDYGQEKAKLEELLQQMKDGSATAVQKINEDEASVQESLAASESEARESKKVVDEHRRRTQKVQSQLTELEEGVKKKLTEKGLASYNHWCRANGALNAFAAVTQRMTEESNATEAEWVDEMQAIQDLAEYIIEADNLPEQRRLTYKFKQALHTGKKPFLKFLKDSKPPRTLVPGANCRWQWLDGLEEQPPSQQGVANDPHTTATSKKPAALTNN